MIVALSLVGALAVAGGAWALVQTNGASRQDPDGTNRDTASGVDGPGIETSESEAQVADFSAYSSAVAAQLEYAQEHWTDSESEQFGFIDENDCVNFTSQTLLARGWVEDDEWWYDESGDAYGSSDAWISSTALRDYLDEHPERATALGDDDRASVKVGDVVQFDWDDSGDRDHTGIVTSVDTAADGTIDIRYAGHTDPTWDRSVDWAITELHPGGVAYYWSIPD